MTKKNKNLPVLREIPITGVAAGGNAIARNEEMVIFVPYGAPGDVVDIRLTRKKSSYSEGKIECIHTKSPIRKEPFCEHFAVCGGCRWQHIRYEEQLKYKAEQVTESIRRIGKVDEGETLPILASSVTEHYRNKLEYTFTSARWLTEDEISLSGESLNRNGLGFHIPGRFDKVLDIRQCYLQDDISNRLRIAIKEYCIAEGYEFFDLRAQQGFMRNIIIRNSATTGEVMLIVVFASDDKARREALLDRISVDFPAITSLLYVVNSKCNDSIADRDVNVYKGNDHIVERMGDLVFRIGAKTFYQTNSLQAFRLYQIVSDFAALQQNEIAYDLYTGAGTIACFIAGQASAVIGIEYVEQAVEDARANAELNGVTNATFFAGDMKSVLTEDFITRNGRPDVIITDPPRAGMHSDVIRAILFAAPRRIVYVSCNPATQSRDIALLSADYEIIKIQPVDMFPHTHHVENVVLMTRRSAE